MSRGLDMWDGYISEFISKGSPRELPEKQRHKFASMLQVPEAVLRHTPLPTAAERPTPGFTGMVAARDVPTFNNRDEIDLAAPAQFIERPIATEVKPAFALWISAAVGRLRPGDLAYFHPHQPPRAGDTAAIVRKARITAIGEVESTDAERIVLTSTAFERRSVGPIPAPTSSPTSPWRDTQIGKSSRGQRRPN